MSRSGAVTARTAAYTQNTIERRFRVKVEQEDPSRLTAAMSLPASSFVCPSTGGRALGPISFIVDGACGLVNHYGGAEGTFAITSELSFELVRLASEVEGDVFAQARVIASTEKSSLAECILTADGITVGMGTVRSFYIPSTGESSERVPETIAVKPDTGLLELLQLEVSDDRTWTSDPDAVLVQAPDPVLNNYMGIVHGAVVATSLDTAAHFAFARHRRSDGGPVATASMRVNYVRPMSSGGQSRYEARILHAGRTSGVCEVTAFDADGRMATIARVTCHS